MLLKRTYNYFLRRIGIPSLATILYLVLIFINSIASIEHSWAFYTWKDFILEYSFSVLLSAAIIESGIRTSFILNHYIAWEQSFWKRFLFQCIFQNVIVIILIYTFFLFPIPSYFGYDALVKRQIIIISVVFSLITASYFAVDHFFIIWKDSNLRAAKLEKETAIAQLEALRLQLDPHFLFNNLSVLTSLIEEDKKIAVEYVQRLSSIYRYILENRKTDVVALFTELRFIKDYVYLYQIKYGQSLVLSINMPKNINSWGIPPLSLQLLVENCIKHNNFDLTRPLIIDMSILDNYLVVKNTINRRKKSFTSNIGLNNIESRYYYLQKSKPFINSYSQYFEVKLPLLSLT